MADEKAPDFADVPTRRFQLVTLGDGLAWRFASYGYGPRGMAMLRAHRDWAATEDEVEGQKHFLTLLQLSLGVFYKEETVAALFESGNVGPEHLQPMLVAIFPPLPASDDDSKKNASDSCSTTGSEGLSKPD